MADKSLCIFVAWCLGPVFTHSRQVKVDNQYQY